MKDGLTLLHNVSVEVFGPDGEVRDSREIHNLVTTVGKEAVATLLEKGTTRPTHLAIGTGTEEAKVANSKLQTEKSRKAATVSVTGAVLTLEKEWGPGEAEGAITEEGIFSAASEGTMFARATFAAVNIGSKDSLKVAHTITAE